MGSACSCFSGISGDAGGGKSSKGGRLGDLEDEKRKSQHEIADFHAGLDFIQKVPLFQRLPLSDHPPLARALKTRKFTDGSVIVKQGDVGDSFFIITSGTANVLVNNERVNTLGASEYFGEQALLTGASRNASIVAVGKVECFELSKEDFERLEFKKKLTFKKRKAIVQQEEKFIRKTAAAVKKKPAEEKMLKEALRSNPNLSQFLPPRDEDLEGIVAEAYNIEVQAGTDVIHQGDIKADLFYILESGTAEAIKDGNKVASYSKAGESFGGLALLYSAPRAATVKVTSNAKLWCIPRGAMRAVLRSQVTVRIEKWVKCLDNVVLLKEQKLSADDKKGLADALVETTFYKDEYIIKEGDDFGDTFYILEEGELEVTKGGKVVTSFSSKGGKNDSFGERALFKDEPRAASVRVKSNKAIVLVLVRENFLKVIKPRKQSEDPYFEAAEGFVKYNYDKLETKGLLGCGGFGKVTLVYDGVTKQYFALKMLSKGHILQERQTAGVMNEKKILRMTHSPFLVQVAATFNRQEFLAFLLEPATGGELFTLYMKHQWYGKEDMARFYGACVTKGLEHLHERSIIYRDMKPENLLLDTKGYCKITDFGLAKFVIGKTFTTCGTPDYFAPELLKGSGHSTALDWWTLGILIFELMTGQTPFSADDLSQMFNKMSKGIEHVPQIAHGPQRNWHDLVKGLCKLNPSERLPVRPGGVSNVVDHKWYTAVKFLWPELTKRTLKAPWNPRVKVSDLSNFDALEDDAPPTIPYKDPKSGWDTGFEDLIGPSTFD